MHLFIVNPSIMQSENEPDIPAESEELAAAKEIIALVEGLKKS